MPSCHCSPVSSLFRRSPDRAAAGRLQFIAYAPPSSLGAAAAAASPLRQPRLHPARDFAKRNAIEDIPEFRVGVGKEMKALDDTSSSLSIPHRGSI